MRVRSCLLPGAGGAYGNDLLVAPGRVGVFEVEFLHCLSGMLHGIFVDPLVVLGAVSLPTHAVLQASPVAPGVYDCANLILGLPVAGDWGWALRGRSFVHGVVFIWTGKQCLISFKSMPPSNILCHEVIDREIYVNYFINFSSLRFLGTCSVVGEPAISPRQVAKWV